MKNRLLLACVCLVLCASCSDVSVSGKEVLCQKQAKNRLQLYNKPDIYPIPEKDRYNALTALFYECMRSTDDKQDYNYEIDTRNAKVQPAPQPLMENIQTPPVVVLKTPVAPIVPSVAVQSPPVSQNKKSNDIFPADKMDNATVLPKVSRYIGRKKEDADDRTQLENIISK